MSTSPVPLSSWWLEFLSLAKEIYVQYQGKEMFCVFVPAMHLQKMYMTETRLVLLTLIPKPV